MIEWSPQQRANVQAVLDRHPASSSRCARAAQEILPTARELDAGAAGIVIEPTNAIYVQAKGHARWFHHVTVSVTKHYVDALTGVDGYPEADYLETYFDLPAEHVMRPVEVDEWEVL